MRRSAYLILSVFLLVIIVGTPQTRGSDVSNDEPTLCPLHHVPLRHEKLEIVYGLVNDPCMTDDHAKAAEKYFPYANSVVYGGCVIFPDSPEDKEVAYCPKCREVEKTWPCLETRNTPIVTKLPQRRVTKRTVRN
jgi:hypothetical protein